MTVTRMIARPLLAAPFVLGAVNALKNSEAMARKAKPVTDRIVPLLERAVPQLPVPHDAQTLVRINAVTQIAAAAALATGRAPRMSSTVLAATLVPTTVAGHAFWNESDPTTKQGQRLHFAKNLAMLGGLVLAAVDTEGKPGVAWRARRAAKDVRREARRIGHEAAMESKLMAKSLR